MLLITLHEGSRLSITSDINYDMIIVWYFLMHLMTVYYNNIPTVQHIAHVLAVAQLYYKVFIHLDKDKHGIESTNVFSYFFRNVLLNEKYKYILKILVKCQN